MPMFNCLIVDDDPDFLTLLKIFVEKHPELELTGAFSDPGEALKFVSDQSVDLAFLDIDMPEISGIEIIRSSPKVPQIIIITSHPDYAVEAFEYDVTDYILKPVTQQRFNKAIDRAVSLSRYQEFIEEDDYIYIKSYSKLIKILPTDITYVQSQGDYIEVNTGQDKYNMLGTLNNIQNKLDKDDFMRVHRKYIVRLDAVLKLEGQEITLENGDTVQVSRSIKPELLKHLKTRLLA